MIAALTELFDTTLKLAERIDESDIEELIALIGLRDEVIYKLQLQSEISEDGKKILRTIGELDAVILLRMTELKEEAAKQIDKVNKTRMQKKIYDKAYTQGSYFIDKKN